MDHEVNLATSAHNISSRSLSSKSSKASSATSSAIKARIKADASHAKLVFSEKEAAIMKEKANLEAHLHVLNLQKAAAAAFETYETGKDHGGESHDSECSPVTSKCTEVCGDSDSPHSCSKISTVLVYPVGNREKAQNMYTVLNDQSNKSLTK